MEDEDGTCLLDVLCDPQALNDFLHGTNELPTEDLLINASSGEPSLFADAPSPGSLLGDGRDSPGTPPPGCVDLSFLEEALLSSPEATDDPHVVDIGPPVEPGCDSKKGEAVEAEEEEVACDILQQSLQEADITEQTMALEAGLAQTGDNLSLYSPAPLLTSTAVSIVTKSVTMPVSPPLSRNTQAAVEPPQPSLLAVGPGCPSLKPAAPPQLMGFLPGNVFPAASPETSFSLSPVQASSMIIHKTAPSVASRPLITPTLRTTAAQGIVLQRAPLPIQPKLPINIQSRLVQISPKPSGQKPAAGLTFVPGTASPNIVLSQSAGQMPAAPPTRPAQQLPKPVSLQLVNQGGSFVLQPQGLFQGQNQFLLPGQSPVTISQPASVARPLLTTSHQAPAVHSVLPSSGQLVDGSQILTVPQSQLNFSPVFTTPNGQLALRQATVLSGHLQLQSAPPTVFQMPAQLAGTYTAGGQGPRATLVHSPALGNHITLINSAGVLPTDLASISIVNSPAVVQGLPFAAQVQGGSAGVPEGQLNVQQASVVLLPERSSAEERTTLDETFQQIPQQFTHLLQQPPMEPPSAGLQSSPAVVTVLQPPQEQALAQQPAVEMQKHLMPSADLNQDVEDVTQSLSPDQAFMQQLQQQALSSQTTSELLVGAIPAVTLDSLASPLVCETPLQKPVSDSAEASPLPADLEDIPILCPCPPTQTSATAVAVLTSPEESLMSPSGPDGSALQSTALQTDAGQVQYQDPLQQALYDQSQLEMDLPPAAASLLQVKCRPESPGFKDESSVLTPGHSCPSPLDVNILMPEHPPTVESPSAGANHSAAEDDPQHKPAAALESKVFTPDGRPASPEAQRVQDPAPAASMKSDSLMTSQQLSTKPTGLEPKRDERLTPAMRRHRFQQQLCSDHIAIQNPSTARGFPTLKDAVRHLLPYHACAGHLPTQEDFNLVDQEFDSVSGFLLKRTKDMVNKYRQLLVRETQQESPSAEMVMLDRLFLQAERCVLVEDRRRARRDPESFMMTLASSSSSSSSSPHGGPSSSSPSSSPAWTRLSDRPPGLKTYRSSSRGGLRLTIKHESGSRKVVRNSACDSGLKRDHTGKLTNGRHLQAANGARPHPCEEISNGAMLEAFPQIPTSLSKIKALNISIPEAEDAGVDRPPSDTPKLKCYKMDVSEQRFSPLRPIQEDNVLSEHLQSAIDSILELQRLQGTSAAPAKAPPGPSLDQAVTSILEGHL
ncbi:BRD4-interacting chromatin-remodeling complex-associated protein [Neosynchiropus ocellatus]